MASSKTHCRRRLAAATFGHGLALLIAAGLITACGAAAAGGQGLWHAEGHRRLAAGSAGATSALPANVAYTVLGRIAVPGRAWGLVAGGRALRRQFDISGLARRKKQVFARLRDSAA